VLEDDDAIGRQGEERPGARDQNEEKRSQSRLCTEHEMVSWAAGMPGGMAEGGRSGTIVG